jgi:uncharacterized lipoprotein YddW (UPF0748 family)
MIMRIRVGAIVGLALLCGVASAQQPEVAIVKATFSIAERPAEGRGSIGFSRTIENGLTGAGVAYEMITEEQVEADGLAAFKLVIFPYSAVWHEREIERVLEFIAGGGKLMCFYTVPEELREPLGIGSYGHRRANYDGECSGMKFRDDRPSGFPAQVHQLSTNLSVVTAGEGGRVIANWHDSTGEDTGMPAVILSENGIYVSHVFKAGVPGEQTHLVLATLGHFLPGWWETMISGALELAPVAVGYETLADLERASAGNRGASAAAREAIVAADAARVAMDEQRYSDALALATSAQTAAQSAATAAFPSRPYELRGAWMGFPTDDTDWEAIMSELEAANFNALFPLMCDGACAAYPSSYLPQFTETDQLAACIEAGHRHGIEIHPWRVNWCILRASNEEKQALGEAGLLVLAVEQARGEDERETTYRWSSCWRDPSAQINRDLEFNMMIEFVEKYDVDGIHFDYMRYPSKFYCYCDRCRAQFEKWAGVTVENWPDDCWDGGKLVKQYREWRRHLQTSLVKRIADRARELDPEIGISLAARASMTGAPEYDAQDWMTWAHEGYLDLLCPMDYTSSVEVLRRKLEPQVEVIDGVIPVYAGIGVSPSRSATPVNLSQQIVAARELGADGFLLFSLTQFTRDMLPAIAQGATATPVTIAPHHRQPVTAVFRYPDAMEGAPERTYGPDAALTVGVRLGAGDDGVAAMALQTFVMPSAGGDPAPLDDEITIKRDSYSGRVGLDLSPGIYQVIVQGRAEMANGPGRERGREFYQRSRPLNILSREQADELLGLLAPPVFETDGAHVGVVSRGYGSEGITRALESVAGIEVRAVHQVTPDFLAACDVVILPQPRAGAEALDVAAIAALREFVRGGGGLLMTHNSVGMKGHPVLAPEIARGEEVPVRETTVVVAADHAISAGMNVGDSFTHSYYDHVALVAAEGATVVVRNQAGQAVVACGAVGNGRCVAWGMATGLGDGDAEVVPTGSEALLLTNAVRWLTGGQ